MTSRAQITQALVTYLLIIGFFLTLGYLTKFPIPQDNKDILLILIGALAAKFGDAVTYWLGSSRSSQAKDAMIANMQPIDGGNLENKNG